MAWEAKKALRCETGCERDTGGLALGWRVPARLTRAHTRVHTRTCTDVHVHTTTMLSGQQAWSARLARILRTSQGPTILNYLPLIC